MVKNKSLLLLLVIVFASCVSKKKYTALENKYKNTQGNLQKVEFEKKALESKFATIQKRIENYNEKITSLKKISGDLEEKSANKLDMVEGAVISNSMRKKMSETLANVHPSLLSNAKTLKDSMNIAVAYNLKKSIDNSNIENSKEINVNISNTIVMISVADNLLFNSASYTVKRKANKILKKLAKVIKSEPSMDVMIEGHTDSKAIHNNIIQDNWDLSVKRATSIVRILEKKYGVKANRLIAAGRGSSMPLFDNKTSANRAKNRRTQIIILPNIDKFFGLLSKKKTLKP